MVRQVVALLCLPLLALAQDPISFTQSVDKRTAYENEQIFHTIELCSSISLKEPKLSNLSYTDFWVHPIQPDRIGERATADGSCKFSLSERALFPLRAGTLVIPARSVSAKVISKTQRTFPLGGENPFADDLWNSLFGERNFIDQTFETDALEINVKPLPPAPAELAPWGLAQPIVGATQIKLRPPTATLNYQGEPVEISLELISIGNLAPIGNVPFILDQRLRAYPEPGPVAVTADTGIALSRKIIKITLIPLEAGEMSVPALTLPYFDPARGSYLTATAPGFPLHVLSSLNSSTQNMDEASTATLPPPKQAESSSLVYFCLASLMLLLLILRESAALAARRTEEARELQSIRHSTTVQSLLGQFAKYPDRLLSPSGRYLWGRVLDESRYSDERLPWFKRHIRQWIKMYRSH